MEKTIIMSNLLLYNIVLSDYREIESFYNDLLFDIIASDEFTKIDIIKFIIAADKHLRMIHNKSINALSGNFFYQIDGKYIELFFEIK